MPASSSSATSEIHTRFSSSAHEIQDGSGRAESFGRFDTIRVRGAREHNLAGVDVDIPKHRLVVFTGVSGSGKSSLVFDTIANESQRLINETYPTFVQGFMPRLDRPDVDALEGITASISLGQDKLSDSPRSTIGTITDAYAFLRVLYSRVGEPYWGSPQAFSFNVPTVEGAGGLTIEKGGRKQTIRKKFTQVGGMCPTCEGHGVIKDIDVNEVLDFSKSLAEGALLVPGYKTGGWNYRMYTESGLVDPDKPVRDYTQRELDALLYHEPTRMEIAGINMTYEGLIPRIKKSMLSKDLDSMQTHIRAFVERAVTFGTCPDCGGTRLCAGARESLIRGVSIAEVCDWPIEEAHDWVAHLDIPELTPVIEALERLLSGFVEIGLGYLSLNRGSATLSGGEAQRTRLVKYLASPLTDATYIFDEPTAGLHPADVARMGDLLLALRDRGNTVLVVEHNPAIIRLADWVIDMGPGAGSAGGQVVFEGSVEELLCSDTRTAVCLREEASPDRRVRGFDEVFRIEHAQAHNLADVSVDIPLGVLCAVTGVAGSGKSSLLRDSISKRRASEAGIVYVDQAPIKGSSRSTIATYTSMLDVIRKVFAKENGVKPALFSSNSEGACPACKGTGTIYTSLGPLTGVTTVCEVCEGKRFDESVLAYTLGGKNISDVLGLTVDEAREFFGPMGRALARVVDELSYLQACGLGYLTLDQSLTTLSGGERQRLKIASYLSEPARILILDEPSRGLHLADVDMLLGLLDRLVERGMSVVVIEHNMRVVAHADWVIDMGPGAGVHGGQVVFEGTPADLAASGIGVTSQYLA